MIDSFPYHAIINTALGKEKADLVIKNGIILNVFTEELIKADIAIKNGFIARIGDSDDITSESTILIDAQNKILVPSFIDAHIHIESSMLTLTEFAKVAVPHGTGAIITDVHELANVIGIKAIKLIAEESKNVPMDVYIMAPSCVPAAMGLDTNGAVIDSKEIRELLQLDSIFGLGEMMNFPGVLNLSPEVISKIDATHKLRKIVDGHAPLLMGNRLQAYVAAGILTDHESSMPEEAIEKLRYGMYLLAREGSLSKNLDILKPIIEKQYPLNRVILVSDDRHPDDLIQEGHLEPILKRAIELGVDPIKAIKMVTINPATAYRLERIGAIAPGYKANFVIIDSLEHIKVEKVFYMGKLVAKDGKLVEKIIETEYPSYVLNTVNVSNIPDINELTIRINSNIHKVKINVIGAMDKSLLTKHLIEEVEVKNGKILPMPDKDILQIIVLDRYKGKNLAKGFVKGLNIKTGAFAQTIAHDSHNIIGVGASLGDLRKAIEDVVKIGGGISVVRDGKVVVNIPLKYAGLMSLERAEIVAEKLIKAREFLYDMGCALSRPFMTLSFLALPVIPKLKITDKGLFDVDKFEFIDLIVKDEHK